MALECTAKSTSNPHTHAALGLTGFGKTRQKAILQVKVATM